jgi:F-box/WD-40 domain protein 7
LEGFDFGPPAVSGVSVFEPTDPDLSEKKRRSLEIKQVVEVPVRVPGHGGGLSSPGIANLAKKQREDGRTGLEGDGACREPRDKGYGTRVEGDGRQATSPDESAAQPPSQFVCPITMELMLDPVILASGHTYDRLSITAWLKTRKTDPMTGTRLRHTEMVPNHALKSAIVEWVEKHGGGVRMQRGASCLPESGHGGSLSVPPMPTPAANLDLSPSPDAHMMEQVHDEIIWAIKKHGDRLFTASADGTCRAWDVDSRRCVHVFDDHRRPVLCIAILSGRFLCTGGYDHRINVYAMDTYRHVATLEGHGDAVRSLIVVDDTLVSGSYDGTCRCWVLKNAPSDGARGAGMPTASAASSVRGECAFVLQGHKGPVRALTAVGGRLFSGSYDSTVMCWDINTGTCLGTLKGHLKPVRALTSLSCSPGEYSCGSDGACNVNGVDGRDAVHQGKHFVVSGSDDATVRVWDSQSLECVATLRGHTDNVRSLANVPGKFILSGSWDKTIRVWDCRSWHEVACLRGHSEATLALAVCRRAGVFFSGSFDCTVRMWSLDTFSCIKVFDIHADAVRVLETDDGDVDDVGDVGAADAREESARVGHYCYSGGYDGSICALRVTNQH